MSSFSEYLKNMRIRSKMTQKELARLSNVDSNHISRMERGVVGPPQKRTLIAIADAMALDSQHQNKLFEYAGYHEFHDDHDFHSRGMSTSIDDESDFKIHHPAIEKIEEIIYDIDIPDDKKENTLNMIRKFVEFLYEDIKGGSND